MWIPYRIHFLLFSSKANKSQTELLRTIEKSLLTYYRHEISLMIRFYKWLSAQTIKIR